MPLRFSAGANYSNVIGYLRDAIVVPPLFHMYQNIQRFTIETFAFCGLRLKSTQPVFDAMSVTDLGHVFHGRSYESGEERKGISWAEVSLVKKPIPGIDTANVLKYLHLLVLCNDSEFRNIKIASSLVSYVWLTDLLPRYGMFVEFTLDGQWCVFKVAGGNSTVSSPNANASVCEEIIVIH